MFGLFKSRKQKLFDRYSNVIHGATMAGIAYGYLTSSGEEEWAKQLLETYVEYESITSELMNPSKRVDARKLMNELFDDASKDEGLLGEIDKLKVEEIESELVRNIGLAKETLARN